MNDLYLIGNGFDLAHGLKTSYNDFLLWYLKNSLNSYNESMGYKDQLISISHKGEPRIMREVESISDIQDWCKVSNYIIRFNSTLFEKIMLSYKTFRWVDIEYEYYLNLVSLYKEIELNPQSRDSVVQRLKGLNSCFGYIKKKLLEYLISVEKNQKTNNVEIEKVLFQRKGESGEETGKKLYVYFNYTSTIDLYTKDKFNDLLDHTVYIHGKLSEEIKQGEITTEKINDEIDHIIFGYGDEIDPYYEKIENLNANEFLENIKSFDYLKTDAYQYVIRFLDEGKFCVKILGHSCGLSDRILLKSIFEHRHCESIKIYYYKKEDYREKTQEISRHFGALKKAKMRMKIVPFEDSEPMPQNPKEN